MKKLFSMAAIFIMVLTLAACSTTEIEDLKLEIEELNQEILDYEAEKALLVIDVDNALAALTELETERDELLEELALLQEKIFDNIITLTFEDEFGTLSVETIGYNNDFDGTLFDLLNDNLEVGYNETSFGNYIYAIEGLNPKTGAYINFSKNGVSSTVGVDLATFENEDTFSFKVLWWDSLQENVDDSINMFLDNHAASYVNSESIDYNVLLALRLLGIQDDYVSEEDVETLVADSTLSFVNEYFKAIMMMNAVGLDSSELISELQTVATPGPYGQTAYALLALDSIESEVDYSAFVTAAMSDFDVTSPYDLGLDAGGISIVSLSNYPEESALVTEYAEWVSSIQLDSGGVLTRDIVWGETTYAGTENASSMSQVILGLLANGIDPTGVEYTKGTNNLVSRLLEFRTDSGSFDYVFGDEVTEDLVFSTPQAFLAIVAYQIYANSYSAVNPYDFK